MLINLETITAHTYGYRLTLVVATEVASDWMSIVGRMVMHLVLTEGQN